MNAMLERKDGLPMDEKITKLIDAAEAVLDSECGVKSLAELAAALAVADPRRDYRSEYPDFA